MIANKAQGISIEVKHCNTQFDIKLPGDKISSNIVFDNIWISSVMDSTYTSVNKISDYNSTTAAEIDSCDKVEATKTDVAILANCCDINATHCQRIKADQVTGVCAKTIRTSKCYRRVGLSQ